LKKEARMMDDWRIMGGGMWAMGLVGLLVVTLFLLGIVAVIKFLRS